METLAPGGVDATAICRGPLCTMVAQPASAAQASTVAMQSCFNISLPLTYGSPHSRGCRHSTLERAQGWLTFEPVSSLSDARCDGRHTIRRGAGRRRRDNQDGIPDPGYPRAPPPRAAALASGPHSLPCSCTVDPAPAVIA